ncbi:MAG: FtsK/SpoIIIE domain-containing protein [Chloroflexota bacterium]
MNTKGSSDFIEAPEPLFKYSDNEIIHDENLAILSTYETSIILDKKQVKTLKSHLKQINAQLSAGDVGQYLAQMDELQQEYNTLRLTHDSAREYLTILINILNQDQDYTLIALASCIRIISYLKHIRRQVHLCKRTILRVKKHLKPYRRDIRKRHKIQQRLKSHYAALEDDQKSQILRKGMAEEANIIAEQIQMTLSRLGFNHRYTVGKKTLTDLVEFDYIVATPDQLQFKINASKQGLWGGSIDLLPHGVWVTDLIKSTVMQELSITLEREVWSPHTSDERFPLVNGAWIVVERLGLVDGIPKYITYRQLMARYDTADHSKLPIPAGIKRGRRINWVYLNSPSAVHIMFTGITNSGKSNTMRGMASALIEKQSPQDVSFVFVDLKKQGDFREFEDAPHCLRFNGKGVLTEIEDVATVLQQVRAEMHMRQQRIGKITTNLIAYNKQVSDEYKMPRIVVVFDEYANTRRSRFSEQASIIDDICIEIGQVGRAAGISLWIGIQQPRRENMPNSLRDNMTTQLVGHQANIGAAQSVTGTRDSLKLENIPGRMLATIGAEKFKVQMPFINDDEVRLAVQTAIDNYGDDTPYQLVATQDTDNFKPLTNEEIVLNLAMDEFDGALKIYPMHDVLKGQMSRNDIKKIVEQFAHEGTVEYEGQLYTVEKQSGNFYALIPPDNEETSSQAYHSTAN